MNRFKLLVFSLAGILLGICTDIHPRVPVRINYQGRYDEGNVPVTGNRVFEFKITNSDGSQIYWASGDQTLSL